MLASNPQTPVTLHDSMQYSSLLENEKEVLRATVKGKLETTDMTSITWGGRKKKYQAKGSCGPEPGCPQQVTGEHNGLLLVLTLCGIIYTTV